MPFKFKWKLLRVYKRNVKMMHIIGNDKIGYFNEKFNLAHFFAHTSEINI